MNFDPVAFAMGKAGVSRNVLSALMAGDGGGGVPGSLEECGWVRSLNGKATVSGNVIDMPTGSTGTYAAIAPPTDIHASRYFVNGDELVVAIKVTEVSHRLAGQQPGTTVSVMTDTTELFTIDGGSGYTTRTGEDVLTWSFTSTAKDGIRFRPLWSNGSTASNCYATLEITGMKFNGSVIYGKG